MHVMSYTCVSIWYQAPQINPREIYSFHLLIYLRVTPEYIIISLSSDDLEYLAQTQPLISQISKTDDPIQRLGEDGQNKKLEIQRATVHRKILSPQR